MMTWLVMILIALQYASYAESSMFGFDKADVTADTDTAQETLASNGNVPVEYGVDVSWPIQHARVSRNYPSLPHNRDASGETAIPGELNNTVIQPLGNKQTFYDDYIAGCLKTYGAKSRCLANERDRVAMSLRQPQSMTNYTEVGFKKIKAPPHIWALIERFWNDNKDPKKFKEENWGKGNTYTNNWECPTNMVSVEDSGLRGGGSTLKRKIWDAARDTIQEWTGEELTDCSLYGVRVYKTGAILATHVDRLPLVSSAIINVAQDLDEPWPLEVYGHDGKATNVTMEAGDMVLYESHSVLHGRPFPLEGRYMANLFVHFEPTGHSLRHNAKVADKDGKHVDQKYKEATARGAGGHEIDDLEDGLPSYVVRGSQEEAHWRMEHPNNKRSARRSAVTGSQANISRYAQTGDLAGVQGLVQKDKEAVNYIDQNGWTPMHEAVRGGHSNVVQYLHKEGADVNIIASFGKGSSPLHLAKLTHGDSHPITTFLSKIGALDAGPEL